MYVRLRTIGSYESAQFEQTPHRVRCFKHFRAETLAGARPLCFLILEFTAHAVFNARAETGSAFNRRFFDNRMLWLSLLGVLVLQVVVVHWPPAQVIFQTTDLSLADWAITIAVAASVLLLEEARKLAVVLFELK